MTMIDEIKRTASEPPVDSAGSFTPGFLESQPVSPRLVQVIRVLGEYKGKETFYLRQTHQVLEALRESAVIQSTESSNRLEGVTASPTRIRALVEEKVAPTNRSEQEIAGYRDVLATIHVNHDHMPLSANLVRQLHRGSLPIHRRRRRKLHGDRQPDQREATRRDGRRAIPAGTGVADCPRDGATPRPPG